MKLFRAFGMYGVGNHAFQIYASVLLIILCTPCSSWLMAKLPTLLHCLLA